MAEYCTVDGADIVTAVIIADASHISGRADGPWILVEGKVGIGTTCQKQGGLRITSLPSTMALIAPLPLRLSMSALTSGTLTYQWKKDTVNITDETSATLLIDPTTASTDDGTYTCEVADGTDTLLSNGCAITVVI